MSNTFSSKVLRLGLKSRPLLITVTLLASSWHVIFNWSFISYLNSKENPCYSPNHAFYVTQYKTLWEHLFSGFLNDYGTAFLYDSSGQLLYRGKTYIDRQSGPMWSQGSDDDQTHPPAVYYMGDSDPSNDWMFHLPRSLGTSDPSRRCY